MRACHLPVATESIGMFTFMNAAMITCAYWWQKSKVTEDLVSAIDEL